MILKSLSRKGGSGHFRQLYDYISRGAEGDAMWSNFLYPEPGREQTVREFERNSNHLRKTLRHNIVYHEILSLKRLSPDQIEMQMETLRTLGQEYLSQRAPNQLSYAAIHTDQSESIHLHMMISANNIDSNRRVRIPKFQFTKIQKDLEKHLHEHYPELHEPTIYNKPWEQSQKVSHREQQLKRRTKAPSKKDQLRNLIQETFKHSQSKSEAKEVLQGFGVTLEQRGQNMVASQGKLRCRLKTLGLDKEFENINKQVYPPKEKPNKPAKDDSMDSLKRYWKERDSKEINRGRSK